MPSSVYLIENRQSEGSASTLQQCTPTSVGVWECLRRLRPRDSLGLQFRPRMCRVIGGLSICGVTSSIPETPLEHGRNKFWPLRAAERGVFFLELRGRPGVWVLSPSLPADLAGGSAGASTFRVSLPLPKPRSAPTELTLESRRLLSVHVVIHRHSSTGMCFVPDDEADAFQGHPADNQGVTRGAWLMVLGLGKPYVCATGP